MNVASSAAARPTKIETSEPFTTFFSTSRPHLSPPKGSVSERFTSVTAILAARSSHSL